MRAGTVRVPHAPPAILVVAVALAAACCGRAPSRPPAAAITVEALTPRGASVRPFEFTWKTNAPPGTVCRVSVYDEAERPLYERDTREGRLAAPADMPRDTARRLLWRVSVLGEDGAVVSQSPLVEFVVK